MKVLVTGGAGFIGSRLCSRLARGGHDVTSVDIREGGAPGIARKICDLTQHDDVLAVFDELRPRAVYHLAGPVLDGVRRNPSGGTGLQLLATMNVLDACRPNHSKVLLASSFYVYQGVSPDTVVDEVTTLDMFRTPAFGAVKLMAESLVRTWAEAYDLRYGILRFGSAYGWADDCSNVVGDFIKAVRQGEPLVVWGRGTRRNQFTYVEDIVEGCARALLIDNQILNLVSPEELTTAQLADLLAARLKSPPVYLLEKAEPSSMAYISARKAMNLLGWQPRPLKECLELMLKELGM